MLTILSSEELPSEVVDEIGEISEGIGFTPNVARLLALTPSHFVGWWRYFDELMRGPSGLSKTQREMIAVVVSAEADCPYCEVAHAATLRLRDESFCQVPRGVAVASNAKSDRGQALIRASNLEAQPAHGG